jgi:hypothetical protein
VIVEESGLHLAWELAGCGVKVMLAFLQSLVSSVSVEFVSSVVEEAFALAHAASALDDFEQVWEEHHAWLLSHIA